MKIIDLIKNIITATLCLILIITNLILWLPLITNEYTPTTIIGESMNPTLRSGDFIIIKDVNPAEIEIGDIITIRYDDYTITHRLIEKIEGETNYYRIKGDNNEKPDPGLFNESKIIGKLVLILPLSHLFTAYGFTLAIVIPLALTIHRSRKGKTPMQDMTTLLLFATILVSASLTISHYFLNVNTG